MLQLLNDLQRKDFVDNVYPFGEYHHVVMKDKRAEDLLREAVRKEGTNAVAQQVQPDIEDCFIELMRS